MPSPPLADGFSAVLRSDATAALAALMIIAGAHRDIFAWAARMIGAEPAAAASPKPHGGNGVKRPPRKLRSSDRRQANRNQADERLLEAMKDAPGASIGDLAVAIGKSRSSVVTALHRLREAGLAESVEGKWRLIEEASSKEPRARWMKPLSGADRAAAHHLT